MPHLYATLRSCASVNRSDFLFIAGKEGAELGLIICGGRVTLFKIGRRGVRLHGIPLRSVCFLNDCMGRRRLLKVSAAVPKCIVFIS